MTKPVDPDFRVDCIRMKREIQRSIAKETARMTVEERVAYYRHLAGNATRRPRKKAKTIQP